MKLDNLKIHSEWKKTMYEKHPSKKSQILENVIAAVTPADKLELILET